MGGAVKREGWGWRRWWHLEDWELLSLLLDGEGGVRVEDDGGATSLCAELPLLRDTRSLRACRRSRGGEREVGQEEKEEDV